MPGLGCLSFSGNIKVPRSCSFLLLAKEMQYNNHRYLGSLLDLADHDVFHGICEQVSVDCSGAKGVCNKPQDGRTSSHGVHILLSSRSPFLSSPRVRRWFRDWITVWSDWRRIGESKGIGRYGLLKRVLKWKILHKRIRRSHLDQPFNLYVHRAYIVLPTSSTSTHRGRH